jgi:hypothetical protein
MSTQPLNFAQMPSGRLLMADGLNPMQRWDGLLASAQNAGIAAPAGALTLASTVGAGQAIVGSYYAYIRFLDGDGNPSNLSPLSNLLTLNIGGSPGLSGTVAGVANDVGSGTIKVTSTAPHGLQSYDSILITGVTGTTAANGAYTIQVLDASNFLLLSTSGAYLQAYGGGGTWAQRSSGATGGASQFTRTAHGLTNGQNISAGSYPAGTSGYVTINVIDANTFSLNGWTAASGQLGISFSYGSAGITYTNVPVPTDAKVVRRQILRNTNGQTQTFYVDVDTTDISSVTLTTTRSDASLQAQTAVPLLRPDGSVNANRYDVPPAHKNCLAHHLGRMFAAGEVLYNTGNVQVTNGSASVTGIGTAFTSSMVNRFLYIRGATQPYQITTVNTTTQVLTLTVNYADSTDLFAVYGIRPAPAERRLVYYSEAGFPEAWPPTNAFSLQEDGDEITALVQKGAYLYILEKRHAYRFTFQTDPALDAFTFLVLQRGCVNNRSWCNVEGATYLLDEQGIHSFSAGNDTVPLSHTVQDLFRFSDSPYRVNWAASNYFHCVHFPQQETIRWFVAMQGSYLPYHAIALNYREKRWWIEQYSRPIGCSATGQLNNTPQLMVGSDAKKALALWQGTLDGPDPKTGTVRGTATATTLLSVTDTTASFPAAGVAGHPLVLIAGKGKGQVRRIASVSGSTITVKDPWAVLPDTTTQYQIGGIVWQYRSGVFRYIEDEETTTRRLEIIFNPCTAGPCTADMRLFENLASASTKWSVTFDSGSGQGIASIAGSGDLTVDLTKPNGFAQKRLDRHRDVYSDGLRYASVEVAGVTNADPVSVFQIGLDGAYA